MMPAVSIILPTYNAQRTVIAAVRSALGQTFGDTEVIVIDDGSTDRTQEIVGSIKDPRLRVYAFERGGVSAARNRGLALACGEFVALLDDDDLWTEDKLDAQVAALRRRPEAGAAYSWVCMADDAGSPTLRLDPCAYDGDVYAQLLVRNFLVSSSNPLLRRRAVEETGAFDESVPCAADRDYWIRLARRWRFALIPRYQVIYRRRAGSITSDVERQERGSLLVLERAFSEAPPELRSLRPQGFSYTYLYAAELWLSHAQRPAGAAQAARRLAKAVSLNPRLLLERRVRRLVQKCLVLGLLPREAARGLLHLHARTGAEAECLLEVTSVEGRTDQTG